MNEYEIDPLIWYSEREVSFTPKHFVMARSRLTVDSKRWILSTLRGRFSFVMDDNEEFLSLDFDLIPAFEDPQEAIVYELMWSS